MSKEIKEMTALEIVDYIDRYAGGISKDCLIDEIYPITARELFK